MESYELAIQNVKATLFDSVYREQGIVDIFTKRMGTFSVEQQQQLTTLITKQKDDVENILSLLDQFSLKMNDILGTSQEILKITNGNVSSVGEAVNLAAVTNNIGSDVSQEAVTDDNSQVVVNGGSVTEMVPTLPESNVVVDNVIQQPVLGVESTQAVVNDSSPITAEGVVASTVPETTVPVTLDNNSMAAETNNFPEAVQDAVQEQQATSDGPKVEATTVVAAMPDIVQIPGQTGAIDDDNVTSVATPTESGPSLVLSPIEEGVVNTVPATEEKKDMTPEDVVIAAQNQLQAVETVKQEIIADPTLSQEAKAEALKKYSRITQATVKAILVTKTQYEKLVASRAKQKTLLVPQQTTSVVTSMPSPVVAEVIPSVSTIESTSPAVDVQVNEQTLISNGLLSPTVQDKQKEMQTMMDQANSLYKEGKVQEAQDLFNKVSEMNKEIQSNAGGQTLVKS